MLTFFRRIRQGLIDSSSTRKYLLYAIGEIALVVIGILIALQINNWNEERKNNSFERQILTELLRDISEDTSAIKYQIKRYHGIVDGVDYWLNYSYHKDSLSKSMGNIFAGLYFNLNTTTFETLQRKGLHSLRSDELRRTISEYYSKCKWYLDMVNMTSRDFYTIFQEPFKKEHMTIVFYDDGSTEPVPNDRTYLVGSEEFKSFLGYKKRDLQYENGIYNHIIKLGEDSMESIQKYLETN